MKNEILVLMALLSTACATTRTRSSDPIMRVAIDADSMSQQTYVRLQHALVRSGKFIVVDRAMGFKAIAREQERQHETSRFGNNEKYALWGQMYGVGGIIVGNLQCTEEKVRWWKISQDCVENLSLINATTGEVMTVAENDVTVEKGQLSPEWNEVVERLIEGYPTYFIDKHNPHRTVEYSTALEEYREKTVPQSRKPAQAAPGLSDRIQ